MVKVQTQISSVNIFRSGAEITRRGNVTLSEGSQTFYVSGLTHSASQKTARLFCGEGVACSNLRFETASESEEAANINKEIESLRQHISAIETQITLWQTNGDFTKRTEMTNEAIEAYITLLPERIMKLRHEIDEKNQEIEALIKKLNEENEKQGPLMAADLTAPAAGVYPLELRYHENAAAWNPVYEIHTDEKEDLEIRMRARITQNTPEDWQNTDVTLFTGNPSISDKLPELSPVYLDLYVPAPQPKARAASNSMMMGAAMMDSAASSGMMAMAAPMMKMARMETQAAVVNSDETMTEYVLPEKRTILKGGDGTMADLRIEKVPAEYRVMSVPAMDPAAYLMATVKTEDLPDTGAVNADIYIKGIYAGSIYLQTAEAAETMDISLGKEERVRISRREVKKKTSNVLLKGLKQTEYGYETKVFNTSDSELTVVIKDQIPVSENKSITVEAQDLDGASLDAETGILTKTVKVAPKGNVLVKLAYKVSLPKDQRLQENRRPLRSGSAVCPMCGYSPVQGRFCPECGASVR